jgi:hypothetical protein
MILLGKFSETIGVGDSLKDNFDKSKKCVQIADDYGIEFANWLFNIDKEVLSKQLKEFKKEKGL